MPRVSRFAHQPTLCCDCPMMPVNFLMLLATAYTGTLMTAWALWMKTNQSNTDWVNVILSTIVWISFGFYLAFIIVVFVLRCGEQQLQLVPIRGAYFPGPREEDDSDAFSVEASVDEIDDPMPTPAPQKLKPVRAIKPRKAPKLQAMNKVKSAEEVDDDAALTAQVEAMVAAAVGPVAAAVGPEAKEDDLV